MMQIMIINGSEHNRQAISDFVRSEMQMETILCENGRDGLAYLEAGSSPQPDFILYDLAGEAEAVQMVVGMRACEEEVPVVVVATHANLDIAKEALLYGASDLMIAPYYPAQLRQVIRKNLNLRELRYEVKQQEWVRKTDYTLNDVMAVSDVMQATLYLARSVAESGDHLLLEGPRGVGKEWLARGIHHSSAAHNGMFVPVNLHLVDKKDYQARLFGKGAAVGMFTLAKGGTLYIRGIEKLDETMQRHISEAIEEAGNEAPRLIFARETNQQHGGEEPIHSYRNLARDLQLIAIPVPSLRERAEDIPETILMMVRRYAALLDKNIDGVEEEALEVLSSLSWPGNMIQLGNAVYVAVALSQAKMLSLHDFSHILLPSGAHVTPFAAWSASNVANHPLKSKGKGVLDARALAVNGIMPVLDERGNIRPLHDLEEELIRIAMVRYRGHMSRVARHLGIGRSTLYRKVAGMEKLPVDTAITED